MAFSRDARQAGLRHADAWVIRQQQMDRVPVPLLFLHALWISKLSGKPASALHHGTSRERGCRRSRALTFRLAEPTDASSSKTITKVRSQLYLVNCLVPSDPAIKIAAQTRNEAQSFYQLDYVQANRSRSPAYMKRLHSTQTDFTCSKIIDSGSHIQCGTLDRVANDRR